MWNGHHEISRLEIPSRNRETRLWWTVSIDGQAISDFVRPFSAGDSELSVRMGDDGYPWGPEIICRRAGNTVVWHTVHEIDVHVYPRQVLSFPGFAVFDGIAYSHTIGTGNYLDLPSLTEEHARRMLRPQLFPSVDDCLYRLPETRADQHGRGVVRALHRWLQEEARFAEVVDQADKISEVIIGLDSEPMSEARWHFGRHGARHCISFQSNPPVQVWLTSRRFESFFSEGLRGEACL